MEKTLRGDESKKDHGKRMWDLLPWGQVGKLVDVLTFGAEKYGDSTWQNVENARSRYFAACLRHLTAWWSGEKYDPESGIHHLAHAGVNVLFLIWLDDNEFKKGAIRNSDIEFRVFNSDDPLNSGKII